MFSKHPMSVKPDKSFAKKGEAQPFGWAPSLTDGVVV
jgi:hypothetical protein